MTGPASRAGRQAASANPAVPVSAPHAALLIDFDNVTLGVRSDLTKELKTLLNSEIIRGKVAVQRAYADWRRYPQYVMPLTERSIDLIFATAVGSTKKNATDIRLAIDAVELVFTRPEIGTFILLSGDSDFSSLVIKLKEYGKYVIGVGIRESAGDLLIQNCDEYYSYSELAGLTKEAEVPSVQRDPWDLVSEAVNQMARQGDVMRSDRLKQVMQQLDPNFDERNAGFNRFSKFVTEAGNRRLLKVTKLDNGQFEVAPHDALAPVEMPVAPARAEDENGGGRGRGRGRRGGRERERERERERAPRRERGRAAKAEGSERPTERTAAPSTPSHLTLGAAFALLSRALGELGSPVGAEPVRARMAALHGREDPLLDAGRFARLLRQANDADVAEVRKVGEDAYEVALPRSARGSPAAPSLAQPLATAVPAEEGTEEPAPPATESGPSPAARPAMLRFRRGSRGLQRPAEIPLIGVVAIQPVPRPEPTPATAAAPEERPGKEAEGEGAAPKSRGGRRARPAARKSRAAARQSPPAGEPGAGGAPGEPAPPKARGRPRKPR